VRPLLYIAIGISGAVQHIVGISGSCVIISICDDPSAPIVEQSDYYLTGQAQQIAESLIEELEG
jgi:electron transfer flavoprotein alpha subunit